MLTADLDYDLPPDRIATQPAEPRDAARLMVVRRETGDIQHARVRDLPDLLPTDRDLMVFNQTRVLPAAFTATRAATGGRVTGLYLSTVDPHDSTEKDAVVWRVMLESGGKLREGESLTLTEDADLTLTERLGGGQWRAKLLTRDGADTVTLLQRIGSTPLPPYIRNQRRALGQPEVQPGDPDRYNTVLAREPGSVAAPTAALHFTDELLARLDARGVARATLTLHIGLGTFAPVRSKRLEDHDIHTEWLRVPRDTINALHEVRERGGRVIPVGTTSVRALESLPDPLPPPETFDETGFVTETGLFIQPTDDPTDRFNFRFTDALMTNFHLPKSTLIALVAALPGVGLDRLKAWYREAVDEGYRFYSYGDAMCLV